MAFRSRRKFRSRRRASTKRRTAKSYGKRGFKNRSARKSRGGSSRNIARAPHTTTREFEWGSIACNWTGTAGELNFNQPDNLGGIITTPFALQSGTASTYVLGTSASFGLEDLPATFVDFVRNFNFYKIDKISLKFKPRWNTTGQDVNQNTSTLGAESGGGAPRLYIHTQNDPFKINNEVIASGDNILRYGSHTMYDLTKQRLYHLKPSVSLAAMDQANNTILPGVGVANTMAYNRWIDTSFGTAVAANEAVYQGIQMWMEWENPPIPTGGTAGDHTIIDVFATYTVSMKQLEE